ncbi:MAG: 4-(cytidine 5'-diphospho)-2-C-methyl-D-erythritol kinase [Thermodesulfobacteriota bacterium]|nr:4-(cytidine 5'-diphospho)-2-C-methyl-D-erythritol kinase [Thermodesulfobacteriota bacterium]
MIFKADSHAKINLFLYITGKREDGYHTLYSLMTRVALCDCLSFEFGLEQVSISCSHPEVPSDNTNIAARAACLFFEEFYQKKGGKKAGVDITLEKIIPVGAGLGGGSSNAAVVLKVLNKKYHYLFSRKELMDMGLFLGADVPFFIHGGPALAKGVGERLETAVPLQPYHVLLFYPGIQALTGEVYKNMDFSLTNTGKSNIINPLKSGSNVSVVDIKSFLHNDLETAALTRYPDIGAAKKELLQFQPEGVLMSGSGSTFFALFSCCKKAKQAYNALYAKWKGSGKKVFLTSFVQKM